MSVFLQEAKSTPSNYTNGMQYSLKQQFFELHKTMEKYETYYFKTYETITDYGWILRDKIPESILGLSSMSSTSSVTSQDYSYRKLGTMFFYLDKDVEVYNREYTKIQVLAANVGGIVRFFFLFFLETLQI